MSNVEGSQGRPGPQGLPDKYSLVLNSCEPFMLDMRYSPNYARRVQTRLQLFDGRCGLSSLQAPQVSLDASCELASNIC